MKDIDEILDRKVDRKINSKHVGGWWYLVGSAPDKHGRMKGFLLGPYNDYDEASKMAERKHLTHANPVELPTTDLQRAGQILRARRLHGDASFAEIFERQKHKHVGQEETI